jgi:hypothetical protein
MSSLGVELYKKYTKSATSTFDPSVKLRPSDLCSTSSLNIAVNDYPKIVEFNNIADNTAQVHSSVDIDHPLFQPSPNVLVFEDYSAFSVQEKKLFFRNNDSVSIKLLKPCVVLSIVNHSIKPQKYCFFSLHYFINLHRWRGESKFSSPTQYFLRFLPLVMQMASL